MGARDVRRLKIKISNLRKVNNPNFTAVKLQKVCGLNSKCSIRTIDRALCSMNLFSLNTRQKGIMTEKDKKSRVKFCKKCLKLVGSELWLQRISFYYDGVKFYHKSDPFSESIQPKATIWRKRSEGLKLTRKGRKTGNNGRQVKLFAVIAYRKRVIKCQQWDPEVKFTGRNYQKFVKAHFPNTLELSTNPDNKLILQDGCPVQKSKQAQMVYDDIEYKIFSIPARIPTLNPTEKVFNLVR